MTIPNFDPEGKTADGQRREELKISVPLFVLFIAWTLIESCMSKLCWPVVLRAMADLYLREFG